MSWMVASAVLILQYLQTVAAKKEIKEKLQEIIDKLTAMAPELPPVEGVPAPTFVITEPKRNNRYHVFEIDLSVVKTDEALGIQDLVKKEGIKYVTYMTVIAVPAAFTYRVNDKAAPSCDAVVGDEWDDFEITEIYITNTALAGTGKIHVEYRVG